MEIHLWQCVLVGLWTAFCITGMLTGTYLTRCLVMAAGVGVILGDVQTGLAMGAVGELAFLGFGVSSGGSLTRRLPLPTRFHSRFWYSF